MTKNLCARPKEYDFQQQYFDDYRDAVVFAETKRVAFVYHNGRHYLVTPNVPPPGFAYQKEINDDYTSD